MSGGNIIGRRLLTDGTFPAASSTVADTQNFLFAPKAAWDGARFVVAYGEAKSFALKPPADISATLISLNGAIITPGGFPVSASVTPEEMPAVEANNGTTLFGFAKFEDRAPFAAFRARIRRFPFDRDFNIALTPFSRTVAPGATTTFTVNIAANNNFNGEVILSTDNLPNGVTATFNPPTITNGSGSSTLTLTTRADTPESIYRFTVTATSGAQQSIADAAQSYAYDINNSGVVVGSLRLTLFGNDYRAFIYDGSVMRNLNTLISQNSDWVLNEAYGINNTGDIVGRGTFNGQNRAFLLSSVASLNQPPTVEIISPTTNQNMGDSTFVTINASALDADGKADFAVFRHAQGIWYVLKSSDNSLSAVNFGMSGDKLVPADYDGDNKTDFAVFREGIWYLLRSRDGFTGVQFGFGSDKPVPADYDGDGKADIAVFRNGAWYLQGSQTGFTSVVFGAADDKPVPSSFVP